MLIFVAVFLGTFSASIACGDTWTEWFNRDIPDNDEMETVTLLYAENPTKMCEKPTGIECRTAKGAPFRSTGEKVICGSQIGFICRLANNKGSCSDYKVRFLCPEGTTRPESAELLDIIGRRATQSSLGWNGIPGRAVDSLKSTNYNLDTCTHTQRQANNWWMVDLGNSYRIEKVRIFNRADCCRERLNGATIRVGDDANGMLTNAPCGEPVTDADTSAGSVINRQCSPALDGQYVSVSLPNNFLTLCEVEVWGLGDVTQPETELDIIGRRATQSSLGWDGIPGRAVDDNRATDYGQRACTHTQRQTDNWWMVDLGNSYRIEKVRIYNRADCCRERLNGATIRVGDDADGMLTNAPCGNPVTNADTSAGPVIDRQCSPVLDGRYVSVSLRKNFLTLCEVEVFGEGGLTGPGTAKLLDIIGRHATQSSLGWNGIPGRAVDSLEFTNYNLDTCTHTQRQANNWWMVDLGNSYKIEKVRIFNRADCCRERLNGATIRVGDDANGMLTNTPCGEPVTDADTSAGSVINRQCSPALDGQYVSVSLPNNFLTLCEVEVWGVGDVTQPETAELDIIGRRATQSSLGWGGNPGRAVDDNRATDYGQRTCTHTQRQANNWWMVDLGDGYRIEKVRIYNRADCCRERLNGATIRVGDDANGMLTNAPCGEPVTNADTSAGPVIDRQCSPALDGQYVSVSLQNNFLTLCEVEVFI